MNEPRVEQWMRDAAEAIEGLALSGDINDLTFARIIAQHAPPDCERELRELADELGDHVKLTVNPSVQPMLALRWRDEETCDQRAVVGNSIPAAIRAAREAMGR